jgi:hypothetical protein
MRLKVVPGGVFVRWCAFSGDGEKTNASPLLHVRATQLFAAAGELLSCALPRASAGAVLSVPFPSRWRRCTLVVDAGLNLADLSVADGALSKVKTWFCRHLQTALLLHMGAQHCARAFVHQVSMLSFG